MNHKLRDDDRKYLQRLTILLKKRIYFQCDKILLVALAKKKRRFYEDDGIERCFMTNDGDHFTTDAKNVSRI